MERKILPSGIHRATVQQVQEHFVDAYPDSVKRRSLFEGWLAFREVVARLVPIDREYVDGSFVTSRANPKDIDVSFWVDADRVMALPSAAQAALELLFKSQGSLEIFGVDAYLVTVCGQGHPLYSAYVRERDWTTDAWRTPRDHKRQLILNGVHKGYIEVVA